MTRTIDDGDRDPDVAAIPDAERSLAVQLVLHCTECGLAQRRGCPAATVSPTPAMIDAAWDGVVLRRVVTCSSCGAVDRYRVDPADVERLLRRAEPRAGATVVRAVMHVLDGKLVRRPSEAIHLLEDHLRAAPDDPVRWFRLANLRRQLGDRAGAEAGWRKVRELVPDDVASAVLIAHITWEQGRIEAAIDELNRALPLLSRIWEWASSPLRLEDGPDQILNALLATLGGISDAAEEATLWVAWAPMEPPGASKKELVVTMSTIVLAELERWDRLHEFLLSHTIMTAKLGFEVPGEMSNLQRMLDRSAGSTLPDELESLPRSIRRNIETRTKPAPVWISTTKKENKRRRG